MTTPFPLSCCGEPRGHLPQRLAPDDADAASRLSDTNPTYVERKIGVTVRLDPAPCRARARSPAQGAGWGGPCRGYGWGGPARGAGTGGPAAPWSAASPTRRTLPSQEALKTSTPAKLRRMGRDAERAERYEALMAVLMELAFNGATEAVRVDASIAALNRIEGLPKPMNQDTGLSGGELSILHDLRNK